MVQICVRMRILRLGLWALICLNFLNRCAGPKAMVPTRTIKDFKIKIHYNVILRNFPYQRPKKRLSLFVGVVFLSK